MEAAILTVNEFFVSRLKIIILTVLVYAALC
jgi:hypothetical protein